MQPSLQSTPTRLLLPPSSEGLPQRVVVDLGLVHCSWLSFEAIAKEEAEVIFAFCEAFDVADVLGAPGSTPGAHGKDSKPALLNKIWRCGDPPSSPAIVRQDYYPL